MTPTFAVIGILTNTLKCYFEVAECQQIAKLSNMISFQNVMFYDMGSGSTTATIVTYQTVKTKDSGTQPQLQIQGVG